ncbi:MAG TPA: hypothetical protein VLG50_02715, partial [Candidatus Saccharimonadales bacterium]|nr:hypothetical protein [Candidatus Saccharimonadales bacterium]
LLLLFFSPSLVHANMLADMAIMMAGQMGASMANQSISAMYTNMGNAIATDQNNIMTSNQAFQSYIQKASKEEIQNAFNLFQAAQQHMSNLTTEQSAIVNQMDTYIMQAINLNIPQADYIENGPNSDQLFTLGTMYTPDGPVWKNVYPVGNWEYDETTDSFWQMSNVPMNSALNSATSTATPQTASTDKAPNNSIFTDWITRQSSYEILCEITLYQTTYPFFVGIIFNKARWISGDTNRLQNYRLLGLYGDSTKNVAVSYAEQYIPTSSTSTTQPSLYPLQQIIKNPSSTAQQISLNQSLFTTLTLQPITFKIKIITSANTVAYKIWQSTKTSQEPTNFVTITTKNPNLFLYHGIGFMAPGAMAQFKIIKPLEILFTPSARQAFSAEVKTLLTKGATS